MGRKGQFVSKLRRDDRMARCVFCSRDVEYRLIHQNKTGHTFCSVKCRKEYQRRGQQPWKKQDS